MTASLARRGPPLASIESLLRWTLHILQHTITSLWPGLFFYNFLEGMFFSSFGGIMVSHAPFLHFFSLFFKSTFFLEPQYSSFKSPLKPETYLKHTIFYQRLFCVFCLVSLWPPASENLFLALFQLWVLHPPVQFRGEIDSPLWARTLDRGSWSSKARRLGRRPGGDVKDHPNSCFLLWQREQLPKKSFLSGTAR